MISDSNLLLCGCLLDVPLEQISQFLTYPRIGLVEWRLDTFLQRLTGEELRETLSILRHQPRHPVLATNRSRSHGGSFEGPEELRINLLRWAVEAGSEWVDLEDEVATEVLRWFQHHNAQILLSHHNFSMTPDRSTLHRLLQAMAKRDAAVVKIVTYANNPADNLRVLELISYGRQELGISVIAFCMGPLGRWSRVAALLLGSPWTYVQLPGQSLAAPGQFTVDEMHSLLESIR